MASPLSRPEAPHPLSFASMEGLYLEGLTPENCGGSPEDKEQYVSYYKGRVMLDILYPKE